MTAPAVLCCLIVLLSVACGSTPPPSTTPVESPPATALSQRSRVLIIGNVDSEQVARKFKQYQGLAKYLSDNLKEIGIEKGEVIIVSDVDEMTQFLKDGKVDFYFDNPFLALTAANGDGCTPYPNGDDCSL
ncbi:MAG: PhnD/SsuA/transferrin family substrate-binding protein [Chloroflexi bacterium]|nr:PhnD/SsuA/transferrin family substrate-binding protein [Chloroflexota bacterium]